MVVSKWQFKFVRTRMDIETSGLPRQKNESKLEASLTRWANAPLSETQMKESTSGASFAETNFQLADRSTTQPAYNFCLNLESILLTRHQTRSKTIFL